MRTLLALVVAFLAFANGCALFAEGYGTEGLDSLLMIQRRGDASRGSWHSFHGRVFSAEEVSGKLLIQMMVGSNPYSDYSPEEEPIMVVFNGVGPAVLKGDQISAYGYIGPIVSGKNAFGADVSLPSLTAIAIHSFRGNWCDSSSNPTYADVCAKWAQPQ